MDYMLWEEEINLKQFMMPFKPHAKDLAGYNHQALLWSGISFMFLMLLHMENNLMFMNHNKDANVEFRLMKFFIKWTWGRFTIEWSRWETIPELTRCRKYSRRDWVTLTVQILDMQVRWMWEYQTWSFMRLCQICDWILLIIVYFYFIN